MDGGSQLDVSDAPPASALQANATSAMQDADTATLTMNMSISGEQSAQSVQIDASGEINRTQEAMRMDVTSEMMGDASITQYVVGDTMYMKMQDQWVRQNLTGQDFWERGNTQLAAQQQLLQNASVELTGTDVVHDQDVWVLSVEPDPEELEQFARQQGSTGLGAGAGAGAGMAENVELSDVELTQFVDAETYQVRRMDATMNTSVQDQQVSMSMTMELSEIGDAVQIDLPDAARDATSLESQFGGNATGTAGDSVESSSTATTETATAENETAS